MPRALLSRLSVAALIAASLTPANAQCEFANAYRGQYMYRFGSVLTFDSHRERVVLYGGLYQQRRGSMDYVSESYTDVWDWDGTRWTQRNTPGPRPNWSYEGSITYDPIRREIIAVSPSGTPSTWLLDSTDRWRPVTTPSPPARPAASIAFHSGRGTVMLFGGQSAPPYLNDLWEWNGTAWTQINTPNPPRARYAAQMVYDAQRDKLIVIGGAARHPFAGYDEALYDTWEWDGTEWTQGPSLPAPFFAEYAFADPSSGRVIVVTRYLTETTMFERIGNGWEQGSSSRTPFAYYKRGIAFDHSRSLLIFQGGSCDGNCTVGHQYDVTLPGTPFISVQPRDVTTCANGQAQLAATVLGAEPLIHSWQRRQPDGSFTLITNGPTPWGSIISGATTSRLLITNIAGFDSGSYFCVVAGGCGSVRTRAATLTVCAADMTCDGTVDFFDYLLFVDLLAAEDPWADLDRNGIVDFFDYLDFMSALAAGC